MFNKVNTRYLTIVFVALLALVLITVPSGNKKKNRSFKSELTSFETEAVTSFTIYPKAGGESISFRNSDDNWLVSDASGEYNADNNQVESMLGSLSQLRAKRLAAKGKENWEKYELSDSLSTRVKIQEGEKVLADVYVGKFSYSAPQQPASPYMQQQGTMTSFVRLDKEKEVYAVDGFLSMSFNRQIQNYRDGNVLRITESDLQRITLKAPGSEFSVVRNDSIWMVDGVLADSASMADYLSDLRYARSSEFLASELQPAGNPSHTLKLEGKDGSMLAQVDAFVMDSTRISLRSSINPGTWFDGTGDELYQELFRDKSYFLSSEVE